MKIFLQDAAIHLDNFMRRANNGSWPGGIKRTKLSLSQGDKRHTDCCSLSKELHYSK